MDHPATELKSCIQACYACADACDTCAIACLNEPDPAPMVRCIALDVDCAQICRLAAGFMARSSGFDRAVCALCAEVCDACAAECDHHTMAHCQACAAACQACAKACREMVAQHAAAAKRAGRTHPKGASDSPSISVG